MISSRVWSSSIIGPGVQEGVQLAFLFGGMRKILPDILATANEISIEQILKRDAFSIRSNFIRSLHVNGLNI